MSNDQQPVAPLTAISRLTAWLRDYSHNSTQIFADDLRAVLDDHDRLTQQLAGAWDRVESWKESVEQLQAENARLTQALAERDAEVSRWRTAWAQENATASDLKRRLLTAAGDDLCRLTQEEIKAYTSGEVPIPPKGEFIASCERFHAQIASTAGVNTNCLTLAQLVAENERLRQQVNCEIDNSGNAGNTLANIADTCRTRGVGPIVDGRMMPLDERVIKMVQAAEARAVAAEQQLAAVTAELAGFRKLIPSKVPVTPEMIRDEMDELKKEWDSAAAQLAIVTAERDELRAFREREGSARAFAQVCDARDKIDANLAAYKAAAPLCDKHQPNGGTRSGCLICALMKQSAAFSRISYFCGEPNEMQVSHYDVWADAESVVRSVEGLRAERDAVNAERDLYMQRDVEHIDAMVEAQGLANGLQAKLAASEAAAGAMRAAIKQARFVLQNLKVLATCTCANLVQDGWLCERHIAVRLCENALESTAGQGWLSPADAEQLRAELAACREALQAADKIQCEECGWLTGDRTATNAACPHCGEFRKLRDAALSGQAASKLLASQRAKDKRIVALEVALRSVLDGCDGKYVAVDGGELVESEWYREARKLLEETP